MLHRSSWLLLPLLLTAILVSQAVHAQDNGDQVHFGKRIVIEEDQTAGNLVCIGCSIWVAGKSLDAVAVGGSIAIEGTVNGDTVAVGGNISVGDNGSVLGDVATVGGHFSRQPGATIKGSVTSQRGVVVLLALIFIPLLPIILIVAFIVWLVTRNREPVQRKA